MIPASTFIAITQEVGYGLKSILAHEKLRNFDKVAIDAALMGLRASGQWRLVLGSLLPAACAPAQECRRYVKKHQRVLA